MHNHEKIHYLSWKYAKGINIKQSPAGGVDAGLDLSRYTKGEEIEQQTDHGVNEEEDEDLEKKITMIMMIVNKKITNIMMAMTIKIYLTMIKMIVTT